MRLAIIIALNSDRTEGKAVTDVLPISAAMIRFKELRKAGEFPEGFSRLVLSHITLDLEHRFPAAQVIVAGEPDAAALKERVEPVESAPRAVRRRNPGDGQP